MYQFNRTQYQKIDNWGADQDGFQVTSKFYVVFTYPDSYYIGLSCVVGVDVLKSVYNKLNTKLVPYQVDGNASILCDGRNFYYLSNEINEQARYASYADIKIDQNVKIALCARYGNPFHFLDDNVKFYILSMNTSDNSRQCYIDTYHQVNMGAWWVFAVCLLVGICLFSLALILFC